MIPSFQAISHRILQTHDRVKATLEGAQQEQFARWSEQFAETMNLTPFAEQMQQLVKELQARPAEASNLDPVVEQLGQLIAQLQARPVESNEAELLICAQCQTPNRSQGEYCKECGGSMRDAIRPGVFPLKAWKESLENLAQANKAPTSDLSGLEKQVYTLGQTLREQVAALTQSVQDLATQSPETGTETAPAFDPDLAR